jgi:branched-chain amino acid transport system ATP-binding protein
MLEPSLPGKSAKRVFAPGDPAIDLASRITSFGKRMDARIKSAHPSECSAMPTIDQRQTFDDARMTFTLETRDLTIRFGGHVAVNRVSCTFRPGELTAIVGPNGAGKTTYFNLISGQLRPTEGSILLDGAGLGRAFQLTNLFPNLSVEENVRLAVQSESGVHYDMLRPWMTRRDLIARADAILDKVALGGRRSVPATALSHGDQRKLEVALMMALEPKVFMFDEPTAGMSIDEVPVVLNLIAQLKQDASKIILLVEHKMDVVRSLADRIIVLHNGKLVADGKPAEVIASPIVQEAYLGIAPGKSAA